MKTNLKKVPPIPLILYSNESNSFILTPEAQTLFSSIPSNNSIAVITILGPYRTGKSLLLNRVLLSKEQGFQVGNTVNSCTKGLWLYSVTGEDFLHGIDSNNTSGVTKDSTVLIIDTEGFGSVNVSQTHDNRVFLMALLLSSLVIYNSMGTIDENALNQLALITSLSNEIQSKLDSPISMPYFIWILRDFMLKLEDKAGHKITSKDYLETSLEIQKGVSEAIEKKNKVRRMFNHYFPERDCVTLMRPHEDEDHLGRLNELEDHFLRKEFIDQLKIVKTKIWKKSCAKTIVTDSKTKTCKPIIGGTMFMSLCKSFLGVINDGKVTKIDSIWSMVSTNEAQKAIGKSLEAFEKIKEKFLNELKEMNKVQLKEFRKVSRKEILSFYMEKIKHLDLNSNAHEGLIRSLNEGFADRLQKFEKENKISWRNKYEIFCEREMEKFEATALEYDNYFDFREDLRQLEEKFEKEFQGGIKRKQFFTKLSLRLWIKYIESFTRKNKQDRQKIESNKFDAIELMKLVKQKSQKYENNVEKQELSKLFDVLQSQLQESRMVQDQILTSIKDQKEQKENISQNQSMSLPQPSQTTILESPKDLIPSPIDEQVLETNRYLSLALQKLETLYKNQEEKLKKYKEFKKILIAAAYIECIKCNGLFKPNEFLPHANECTIIKKPIESPEISVKFDISEYSKYDNQFALTKKNNDSPELNKILDNYPQTKDFSHIKTINPQALLDNSSPLNTKSHQYNQNSFDYKINATSPINSFDQSKKKSFDYKVNSSSPINNLPQNDRNSITLGYLSSYINPISYTDRLHQETTKVLDREEQRKTKSFYGKPSYDDFDDNNDNLYNMPRPLVTKKSENKGYLHNLKEDSEINTFEGSHHKDLNLPFLKPELGSGYWDSPLNELFKKTTQNNIGEEKLKEFNTTLIPDGEIKTMSYVKKKSKGSSKGSNGNDNEEQGVKGLMKGGMKGYLDRRNSWNVNMTGEFLKKTFD